MNKGIVYLIGAGPGDPGLITVKGKECIGRADVVVYDYLANPRLLSYARAGAEKVYVGKRSSRHSVEQDRINDLLVERGNKGQTVARLKGGDAFVFGRGGEEALYLAEHEIPFEVVPGVSSAYSVPAYAGIPVTHRGIASDVSFITGHEQQVAGGPGIDWRMLAGSGGTLVFLMGVKNLPQITQELVTHGKPADTPAAVIRWGTMADQQTLTGTLETIVDLVNERDFHPPAVIVVGEVVRLREQLAWFEKKPLFGKRIVVTRAAAQSGSLSKLLEARGAEVVEFSTIEIHPVDDYSIFDGAAELMRQDTAAFDWLIFSSANAVDYFVDRLKALGTDLRAVGAARIAAVGTATAARLETQNLLADLVPADFKAEGLIQEFEKIDMRTKKVLLPRAKEARGVLPKALQEMGAEVTIAPIYQNVAGSPPVDELKSDLERGRIDVITFTSNSTARNFAELLTDDGNLAKIVGSARIAAIGPITAGTIERQGLNVDIMPPVSTIPGLVEAIVEAAESGTEK